MQYFNQSNRTWGLIALIALMFATRFHHFGSVSFLPDASLAVFFLAGFYLFPKSESAPGHASVETGDSPLFLGNVLVFTILLVIAGLIDTVAINYGGVSDWCMSPAYLFLIPTYAVMCIAGKWGAHNNVFTIRGAIKITAIVLVATSLAFVISNGSFYFFSDRYGEMDWLTYGQRTSQYYLPYVVYTLLYCGVILTVHGYLKNSIPNSLLNKLRFH